MNVVNITNARTNLYNLVKNIDLNSEPIMITGKHNNAVLISEEEWRSIQETLYLTSIPNMATSIIDGINTPSSQCSTELNL